MSQVIVYTNSDGGVSICYPTGELPIEEVLQYDCPAGAVIIDDSTLPQGADAQFIDAWELNGTTVTCSLDKAKAIKLNEYNQFAVQAARRRQANTLTGLPNIPDDATWLDAVKAGRDAINAAATTQELIDIPNPTSR